MSTHPEQQSPQESNLEKALERTQQARRALPQIQGASGQEILDIFTSLPPQAIEEMQNTYEQLRSEE